MNILGGGFSWGVGGYKDGPVDPEHMQGSGWKTKNAWDLEVRPGTDVYSIIEGIVVSIKSPSAQNTHLFGTSIEISGRGRYSNVDVFYCNLSSIDVRIGEKITLGEKLGKVAKPSSGKSPFLHVGLSFGNSITSFVDSSGNINGGDSSGSVATGAAGAAGLTGDDDEKKKKKKNKENEPNDDPLLKKVYGGLAKGLLPLAAFGGLTEEVNRIKKLMK